MGSRRCCAIMRTPAIRPLGRPREFQLRANMDYLGISQERLEKAGGYWTAREISQQPTIWPLIGGLIAADAAASPAFLDPLMQRSHLPILLTGARTSGFLGEGVGPALGHKT